MSTSEQEARAGSDGSLWGYNPVCKVTPRYYSVCKVTPGILHGVQPPAANLAPAHSVASPARDPIVNLLLCAK